jgi:hypothetical protein
MFSFFCSFFISFVRSFLPSVFLSFFLCFYLSIFQARTDRKKAVEQRMATHPEAESGYVADTHRATRSDRRNANRAATEAGYYLAPLPTGNQRSAVAKATFCVYVRSRVESQSPTFILHRISLRSHIRSSRARSSRVRAGQVKSGQVRPSQVESGQVRSSQVKGGQAKPSEVRSSQVRDRSRSSHVTSIQVLSGQLGSGKAKSSQAKSSQPKSSQVKSSQDRSGPRGTRGGVGTMHGGVGKPEARHHIYPSTQDCPWSLNGPLPWALNMRFR